ncbi:MAG: tetratricopeptide repeat protein [Bacteroidaceae bacterium]|nr:tetratricopeptide repeat protein [Bacteroidaceae bacterium]
MMRKIILLLWLSITTLTLSAQTLTEARKLYADGNYAEAKPAFEKLVKATPTNANFNLWYGVCALRTGDAAEALPYLQTAVKRKAQDSQLFLAEACNSLYLFEEAVNTLETYISDLQKRRRTSPEAEDLLEKSHNGLRMIRGVEQVTIIDSIVVDKADFVSHYNLGADAGNLLTTQQFFGRQNDGNALFITGLGDKLYYSQKLPNDSTLSLLTAQKLSGQWSEPTILPDNINEAGSNTAYPFVLPDGITIYFASDGEESFGGYDIFVTRHDPSDDTYFTPENIGMPFNSPYNDYMYAIDEFNNLGWFATDRYQPAGKVCIYVFIPNETKSVYSFENTDATKLARLAQIHAIRDTWADQAEVRDAQRRLAAVDDASAATTSNREFVFVINDNLTYYQLSDFKSAQARLAFEHYRQVEQTYLEQQVKLYQYREQYASGNASFKEQMGSIILQAEQREQELYEQMLLAAKEVRKLEKP